MDAMTIDRTLTELDHVRLSNLLRRDRRGERAVALPPAMEQLLDGCAIVASRQVAPDVVTMYSQIELRDPANGQLSKITLCYPADANPATGFVSVLSPVGSSLLGLQVGDVAQWRTPTGEAKEAEVVAVLFQPEASGDYVI